MNIRPINFQTNSAYKNQQTPQPTATKPAFGMNFVPLEKAIQNATDPTLLKALKKMWPAPIDKSTLDILAEKYKDSGMKFLKEFKTRLLGTQGNLVVDTKLKTLVEVGGELINYRKLLSAATDFTAVFSDKKIPLAYVGKGFFYDFSRITTLDGKPYKGDLSLWESVAEIPKMIECKLKKTHPDDETVFARINLSGENRDGKILDIFNYPCRADNSNDDISFGFNKSEFLAKMWDAIQTAKSDAEQGNDVAKHLKMIFSEG